MSSRLTRDGRFLVFERDVTEKTNYDVIGGTKNQLEALPLAGGAPRVLLKPADQRSLVLDQATAKRWPMPKKATSSSWASRTRSRGQLTGRKRDPADKTDPGQRGQRTTKRRKSRRSPSVRFSPDGGRSSAQAPGRKPDEDKDKTGQAGEPAAAILADRRQDRRQRG